MEKSNNILGSLYSALCGSYINVQVDRPGFFLLGFTLLHIHV